MRLRSWLRSCTSINDFLFYTLWIGIQIFRRSKVEYAQKEVIEMLVSGDHARKILEICGEFLQLNEVVRFDVVPTPDKLSKGLFL